MNKQRGVTLIELLTVIVVLGLLTAIAVPSYSSYMRKTKRADAKVALTSTAQQLERCYTRYYSYLLSSGGGGGQCPVVLPYTLASGTYTIDADTAGVTANAFAIKATPIGNQAADTHCGTFQLNQNNLQTVSTGATDCW